LPINCCAVSVSAGIGTVFVRTRLTPASEADVLNELVSYRVDRMIGIGGKVFRS
jgi:hypothetical protein